MKAAKYLLALALTSAGCGAASFEPRFQKPVAPTEIDVAKKLTHIRARSERPVAVGLTTDPMELCAWDLEGKLLWSHAVAAKSNPLIAGDAVVIHEADGIVVRDLANGKVLRVVDDEGHLIGADGIGHSLVIAIGYDGTDPRSVVVMLEGDSVRFRQALSLPVGVPALLGEEVLVPWATQRLSVLSAKDGLELARWTFPTIAMGQAVVHDGHAYVGQHGLVPVDAQLPALRDGPAVTYSPLKRPMPGQPALMRDGYKPVPEPDSAENKLHIDWQMAAGAAPPDAEGNLLVQRFYRVLFGFAADKDELRWVRVTDKDVVGATVAAGGAWVADSGGHLELIDGAGETQYAKELGKALRVLAIRPGTFAPAAAKSAAKAEANANRLHDELLAAAKLTDDRLWAARAYAIDRLASLPDERVTGELIALCGATENPEPVTRSACARLGERTNGANEVILSLRTRGAFLEPTAAPPVGALAQAAVRMKLKQSAPLLLSQAEDPHTTAADLASVIQALEAMQHRPAVTVIERFLRLHHAEPPGSELTPALYAAVSALGSMRAKTARPTLEDVASDGLTPEPLRLRAREALGVIDTPPVQARPAEPAEKPAPQAEEPPAPVTETDPRPYALDADAVQRALRPSQAAMTRCLENDPSKPKSARLSFIVAGDGRVEGMLVTPTSLQACLEPLLRTTKFPETRVGRQHLTHVLESK